MSAVGSTTQIDFAVPRPRPFVVFDTPATVPDPEPRRRLRSAIRPLPARPSRPELERACRIALLEASQPVPIETIYDRIVKRGSLTFFGYKRPFRALASAMYMMARRGEVSILLNVRADGPVRPRGCQRLWQLTPRATHYYG